MRVYEFMHKCLNLGDLSVSHWIRFRVLASAKMWSEVELSPYVFVKRYNPSGAIAEKQDIVLDNLQYVQGAWQQHSCNQPMVRTEGQSNFRRSQDVADLKDVPCIINVSNMLASIWRQPDVEGSGPHVGK